MARKKEPAKAPKPPASKTGASQPPPESDKAPRRQKSGASKASERKGKELELIRSGFAELLTLPAMPMALAGDGWAADHFTTRGPLLAQRLAAECERNAELRKWCLKALQGQSVMMLGVELFMYAVPVGMHFGLIPGAEALGVPVRKPKAPPAPAGPQPAEAPPFIRHPDGRVTRRDGSPLTGEDEADLGMLTGEPNPNGDQLVDAPPIEPL
jgi:hypothetical protein